MVCHCFYYQKVRFWSVFLGFGPGKNQNWSDLSLILSEIWSVFGPILAILGPEYKVEALSNVCFSVPPVVRFSVPPCCAFLRPPAELYRVVSSARALR